MKILTRSCLVAIGFILALSIRLVPSPATIQAQKPEFEYEIVLTIDNEAPLTETTWSPDGRRIAAVEPKQPCPLIKIWNAQTGELLYTFEPPGLFTDNTDVYLAWNPDGTLLASTYEAYDMDFVHIWDMSNGELSIIEGTGRGTDIAWSPDGTKLAIAHGHDPEKTASIWTLDGDLVTQLEPAPNDVFIVSWSPDGKYLLTADLVTDVYQESLDNMWQVWDTETYQEAYRLEGVDNFYFHYRTAWNLEGTGIWGLRCEYMNCRLIAWDISSNTVHVYDEPAERFGNLSDIVLSPLQPLIASVGGSNIDYIAGIMFWNTSGQFIGTMDYPARLDSLDWSPTRDILVTTDENGQIIIWKIIYEQASSTS
ncbi:MAG: WD40 repeat domain-containing protein [Anaerolineae bacterium]|nr:WD40 repeat domain-containing protein [Anaerolineae bacterium]